MVDLDDIVVALGLDEFFEFITLVSAVLVAVFAVVLSVARLFLLVALQLHDALFELVADSKVDMFFDVLSCQPLPLNLEQFVLIVLAPSLPWHLPQENKLELMVLDFLDVYLVQPGLARRVLKETPFSPLIAHQSLIHALWLLVLVVILHSQVEVSLQLVNVVIFLPGDDQLLLEIVD